MAHFLLCLTLCKAVVRCLGENNVKAILEKNIYVCTDDCVWSYSDMLSSGIYPQALTNTYFNAMKPRAAETC